MGLEAYLFHIEFMTPISESRIIEIFESTGLKHLPEKGDFDPNKTFSSYFFETRTDMGLTECHCLLNRTVSNNLESCKIRFSLLTPKTVIDQTFKILSNLNNQVPIKILDSEILNQIYLESVRSGDNDSSFKASERTEKESKIKEKCYIPIDAEEFKKNKLKLNKRNIVINHVEGEIIESGPKTIDSITKKGSFDSFLGWIKQYIK